MSYYLIFLSKVFQKLGSKSPIDSAIIAITFIQCCFTVVIIAIIKMATSFDVSKAEFMAFICALAVFNFFLFKRKKWSIVRRHRVEKVTWFEVAVGLLNFMIASVGVLGLFIPISKLFK
ncbi:hypothetical protein [Pontibacter vulgaris]|uniref:hypothetical protein n=1 Tax=Pontibacter vulgaris TaxID=2905679 RepID=UPI001FA812BB|nr:hypothetical protein [Pontibacter vulgaris]